MRCITSPRPRQWGRSNSITSRVRDGRPERVDAGGVRSVAAADEQRRLVEPERVAALGRRGRLEPGGDRHAGLDEIGGQRVHFEPPALLAGAEENGAASVTSAGS